jgi:hypothetical protein
MKKLERKRTENDMVTKHEFQHGTARITNRGKTALILAVWLLASCSGVMAANMPMYIALPELVLAESGEAGSLEYQLKAAFLYNFMKFIEFSDSSSSTDADAAAKKEPIILAILGEDLFGKHLDDLTKKVIKDRPIRIIRIEGFEQYKSAHPKATQEEYFREQQKAIESCRLLFVSRSEEKWMSEILAFTEKMRIITASDTANFASKGGLIEFVMEENKIRFDINVVSAEQKGLKVSSQLLQLARNVIKKQQ